MPAPSQNACRMASPDGAGPPCAGVCGGAGCGGCGCGCGCGWGCGVGCAMNGVGAGAAPCGDATFGDCIGAPPDKSPVVGDGGLCSGRGATGGGCRAG